jgi:hypothetical protein
MGIFLGRRGVALAIVLLAATGLGGWCAAARGDARTNCGATSGGICGLPAGRQTPSVHPRGDVVSQVALDELACTAPAFGAGAPR